MTNSSEREPASQKALAESEERFRTLVQQMPDGVCIHESGCIIFSNEQHWRMLGFESQEEIIGADVLEFIAPESRELVRERMEKRLQGERVPERYEIKSRRRDGTTFDSEVIAKKIFLKGRPVIQVVLRDISERRRMEEEIIEARKHEALSVLTRGIAHAFNNVLTGIVGNISLARLYAKPGNQLYDRLTAAEQASWRARRLTQQLLAFGQGGLSAKTRVTLGELLTPPVRLSLMGRASKCEFLIPDDLWPMEVDQWRMIRVIDNLLANADEAMPEPGTITLRAVNTIVGAEHRLPIKDGKYVKISVEDRGVGIPEEHLGKVFDPYFTTRKTASGLGLFAAYSTVKDHGGHIAVESKIGVGTSMHVYLPAAEEEMAKPAEWGKEPVAGGMRILMMDDEDMVRNVAEGLLTHLGYEVALARDGAEAVERYKQAKESGRPFDVVIIDLTVYGGMGGRETLSSLREIDPEVKAILSSGYSNDPAMVDFREYGFGGILTKPYQMEELKKALQQVMEQPGK